MITKGGTGLGRFACWLTGHRWQQVVPHDMPNYLAECRRCGAMRWLCRNEPATGDARGTREGAP